MPPCQNSRIVKASFCPTAPHRLALVTGTLLDCRLMTFACLEEGGAVAASSAEGDDDFEVVALLYKNVQPIQALYTYIHFKALKCSS